MARRAMELPPAQIEQLLGAHAGPVPRILVGTLDVSRRTTVADLYLELSKTYGGVCMAWIGSKPVVVVNGKPLL